MFAQVGNEVIMRNFAPFAEPVLCSIDTCIYISINDHWVKVVMCYDPGRDQFISETDILGIR